jgi:crossover junction endodeoxyribonuclease RusA
LTSLHFTVEGRPYAWQRPIQTKHGRVDSTEQKKRKHAIHWAGVIAIQELIERCCEWRRDSIYTVIVDFYMPSSAKVDVDNLTKLVLDALNGTAWNDDSQVRRIECEKRYDKKDPRTEVSVYVYGQEEAEE